MSLSKNRINLAPLAEEPQGNEGDIAIIAGRLKYFYNGQWIQYGGYGFPIGYIGSSPLVINENLNLQRYLNGQKIAIYQFPDFDQALVATANVYPNILKTETEWQAVAAYSVGGQCGYFVRDEEEGTIRLPKIIMPIQGLTDLTKLGDLVEAGLPNHTHFLKARQSYASGSANHALYTAGDNRDRATSYASASNPIYGNSDTVQQEQIQYPYFIQVATGVENIVDVTREIQLNNPYTLFDCKYSETKLYNISWLLSSGQWNSKATYPTAYDALLVEYNAEITEGSTVELPSGTSYTKRGLSVKLSTETFTDYDFVLNTAEETFRLPIRSKLASSNFAKGNGKTLGLTDGTTNAGLQYNVTGGLSGRANAYGQNIGGSYSGSDSFIHGAGIGVVTDSNNSGIELDDSNLYLYFYIGETIQDANLINVSRIEETKANIDMNNLSTAGKAEITSYSFPNGSATKMSLSASGQSFVAPSAGYFILQGINLTYGNPAAVELYLSNNGETVKTSPYIDRSGTTVVTRINATLPVQKNDTIIVIFAGVSFTYQDFTNLGLYFIPAKGVAND